MTSQRPPPTDADPTHPTAEKLSAFGLGLLGDPEATAIEDHVSGCDACCEALRNLANDALVAKLRDSPTRAVGQGIPAELSGHPRYRVLEQVGAGGMGAVYKAQHLLMDRVVALKLISRALVDRPEAVERFRREVQATAQLVHPNIVTAHDAEEAGGVHFLVMEFVEGTSLAQEVARRGRLPVREACEYVRQAALGLQHAFERGMVHRDIKPQNLMLTPAGTVKILDFGLAQLAQVPGGSRSITSASDTVAEHGSASLTKTGAMMGTPDYIAPEQIEDARQADTRSDIYSLGCTLYALLAGQTPFPEGTAADKLRAHREGKPRPLSAIRRDLPSALLRVIDRMMARDPARRYQAPGEVARALQPFARPAGAGLRTVMTAVGVGLLALGLAAIPFVKPWSPAKENGTPETQPEAKPDLTMPALDQLDPENIPPAERFDWQPKELVAVLGEHRWRHWSQGGTLAMSRDGSLLASVPGQGVVYLWGQETGRPRILRTDPSHVVSSLALSPDGRLLAWGRVDEKVCVTDARTGAVLRMLEGDHDKEQNILYTIAAFAPDSRTVAAVDSKFRVQVWDALDGKRLATFAKHPSQVLALAFSPDGKRVASAGIDPTIRIWEARTGKEETTLARHTQQVNGLVFAPDGKTLASASLDQTVLLWDVTGRGEVRQTLRTEDSLLCLAFSPNGKGVAGGGSKFVHAWDVGSGLERAKLGLLPAEAISSVLFTPDGGTVVGASTLGVIRHWDLATQKELPLTGPQSGLSAIAFTPDGSALAANGPALRLHVWFPGGKRPPVAHPLMVGSWPGALAFGRGATVVLPQDTELVTLDPIADTGSRKTASTLSIMALATYANGTRVATGSMDKAVKLWDLPTLAELSKIDTGDEVWGVAVSPDDSLLATVGNSRKVQLWDLRALKHVRTIEGHTNGLLLAVFSPDGKLLATAGGDNLVKLWDVRTGEEKASLGPHEGSIAAMAFDRTGARLAASGWGRQVVVWDVTRRAKLYAWDFPGQVMGVAFAPDGRHLATANGNGTIYILRLPSGS